VLAADREGGLRFVYVRQAPKPKAIIFVHEISKVLISTGPRASHTIELEWETRSDCEAMLCGALNDVAKCDVCGGFKEGSTSNCSLSISQARKLVLSRRTETSPSRETHSKRQPK
jgi:hypothetical protein